MVYLAEYLLSYSCASRGQKESADKGSSGWHEYTKSRIPSTLKIQRFYGKYVILYCLASLTLFKIYSLVQNSVYVLFLSFLSKKDFIKILMEFDVAMLCEYILSLSYFYLSIRYCCC